MMSGWKPDARTVEIGEAGEITDASLAAMEDDELGRLKVAVEEALRLTRAQMKAANIEYRDRGRRLDPAWYRSARNAAAQYVAQVGLIHAEFTRRRGGAKSNRKAQIHREFVNVARDKLSAEVFQAWLDEAVRRLRSSGVRTDDFDPNNNATQLRQMKARATQPKGDEKP